MVRSQFFIPHFPFFIERGVLRRCRHCHPELERGPLPAPFSTGRTRPRRGRPHRGGRQRLHRRLGGAAGPRLSDGGIAAARPQPGLLRGLQPSRGPGRQRVCGAAELRRGGDPGLAAPAPRPAHHPPAGGRGAAQNPRPGRPHALRVRRCRGRLPRPAGLPFLPRPLVRHPGNRPRAVQRRPARGLGQRRLPAGAPRRVAGPGWPGASLFCPHGGN